jgi:cytochrome b561
MGRMARASDRYGTVAVLLHWTIAILVLFNIYLGWQFDDLHGPTKLATVNLHKSIGMTVLALSVLRLIWRLVNRPPPLSAHLKPYERVLARVVHWLFYVFMIGMPLVGWAMSSASPKIKVNPITFFNLFEIPAFPGLPDLPHAQMHQVHELLEQAHTGYLLWMGYALIVLHVAGALKHQFIDRDGELGRMIPFLRAPGLKEPR